MDRGMLVAGLVTLLVPIGAGTADAQGKPMPRDLEVRLALSGLPEHLRADATAYVRGNNGYEIARRGTNGFSCIVRRQGVTPAQFHRSMVIVCYDAEGSRTLLKSDLDQGRMFARGMTRDEITTVVRDRWGSGEYEAPGPGIAYMLSPVMRVNNFEGPSFDYIPHIMMYAAGRMPADIGMATPPEPRGHLPFMTEPGEPFSMVVVPMAESARNSIIAAQTDLVAEVAPYLE